VVYCALVCMITHNIHTVYALHLVRLSIPVMCSSKYRPGYIKIQTQFAGNLYRKVLFSVFPVAPTFELRASVKRFVSLQFPNPKTVGRTPWTGDQPVARPLPTNRINAHRHRCLEWDSNPRSQRSSERRQYRKVHCNVSEGLGPWN
jgi:hypothetical protein